LFKEKQVYIFKMAHISKGDTIPDANLYTLEEGAPKAHRTHDLFKGKKVVIFGLPGAYTTTCSQKQVPEYYSRLSEFTDKGIDGVYCVSVNDPFVMQSWAKSLDVDTDKLCFLGDGDAWWHQMMGLTQILGGLGTRALRYSMMLDDLKVQHLNVEEPGPTCYRISGPSTILKQL